TSTRCWSGSVGPSPRHHLLQGGQDRGGVQTSNLRIVDLPPGGEFYLCRQRWHLACFCQGEQVRRLPQGRQTDAGLAVSIKAQEMVDLGVDKTQQHSGWQPCRRGGGEEVRQSGAV